MSMKHSIIGIVSSSLLLLGGCNDIKLDETGLVPPTDYFKYIIRNTTDMQVEIYFHDYENHGGEIIKLTLPSGDSYSEIDEPLKQIDSPDLEKYGLQSAIDVIMKEKAHFVFADGKELWHKCLTIESHIFPEGIFDIEDTWEEVKTDDCHYIYTYTIDETLHEQATVMAEE